MAVFEAHSGKRKGSPDKLIAMAMRMKRQRGVRVRDHRRRDAGTP